MRDWRTKIEKHPLGRRLLSDPVFRVLATAALSMGGIFFYALLNAMLCAVYRSYWFLSMTAYCLVLGGMRLYALAKARQGVGRVAARRCGWGMLALAVTLSGVVCMAIADKRNPKYHIVVMISLAAYTFYLIAIAVINAVKAHRKRDGTLIVLRDVSLAGVVGSVLSLERAMLGSFGDGADVFTFTMEAASGAVAFLLLLAMGLSMIRRAGRED